MKRCGQENHLKAGCPAKADELVTKCSYCFEEGHRRGGCQKKRQDEQDERKKFKMEKKDPMFGNPLAKQDSKAASSKTIMRKRTGEKGGIGGYEGGAESTDESRYERDAERHDE